MAKQMQRQVMYPMRRLYCNKWQNLEAKDRWQWGMWLSAEEKQKYRQALCKRLQHNSTACKEYKTGVVLVVRIRNHIPGANHRRTVGYTIRQVGDGQHVILRQRVRCSIRAVMAVWNSWVFLRETRGVADALHAVPYCSGDCAHHPARFIVFAQLAKLCVFFIFRDKFPILLMIGTWKIAQSVSNSIQHLLECFFWFSCCWLLFLSIAHIMLHLHNRCLSVFNSHSCSSGHSIHIIFNRYLFLWFA
jgi:hypothetical protein